MFQVDLSESGSDSALCPDDGAMSPVLGSKREREAELKPRFVAWGLHEYTEVVLDDASQDALEWMSGGTAKSGDGNGDVAGDSEAFDGVNDRADDRSRAACGGVVALTRRICWPDEGSPCASPRSPSAGESEALAFAEEEPPVVCDVDGYDGAR
jgi:hypothetical protein